MKAKALILAMALPALTGLTAAADPNYTVVGSVLGALAGAAVANNVDGVSKFVAIPAGALLGGVVGNQYRKHSRYNRCDDYGPRVIVIEKTASVTPVVNDPHPGVDLIKVSILNANGIRTDVPVLRTAGKFVGPQGETYETLPTATELARRYGM